MRLADSAGSHGRPRRMHSVAVGIISLVVVVLLGWVTARAVTLAPSFDGAMNLQVSWSLAQGEGYRRTYADRPAFPREVQTNTPVTVPAAAVYKVFGMGRAQSQAVSLLYLYALLAVGAALVGRRFGMVAGGIAALILLVTPGLAFEGLKAYGEVPSLVWALAGLCLLPVDSQARWRPRHMVLAGMCFGLALATKTVIAICVGAFGLCIVAALLADRREPWPRRLGLSILLGIGTLLPLLAVEAWRLSSLGGLPAWQAWWLEQWSSISAQTGTQSAPSTIGDYARKGSVHLEALARMHGLTPGFALAWLAMPFPLAAVALWQSREVRRHLPLLALLLAILVYFGWWLLLTPDNKLWHRRILSGGLMLDLAWVHVTALLVQEGRRLRSFNWAGPAMAATAVLCGWFGFTRFLPALTGPGASTDYIRAVEIVSALPPDAAVFGLGWNSAPQISLLARRPFRDFNDFIPTDADREQPAYLVLDGPGLGARSQYPAIETYPAEELMPGAKRAQVYRLDLSRVAAPGRFDPEIAQSFVSFSDGPYGPSGGIQGGNWMGADAFIRLVYDGSDDIFVRAVVPGNARYRLDAQPVLALDLDGCDLGAQPLQTTGRQSLRVVIPEHCRPDEGAISTLRLMASDVIDQYIGGGGLARSVVIQEAGFAPGCPERNACEPPRARPRISGTVQRSARGLLDGNTPAPVCDSTRAMPFEVRWNATPSGHERVQLLIRGDAPADKVWAGGQPAQGSKRTGPWMRPGMAIVLATPEGNELDVLEYTVPACDAPTGSTRAP